MTDVILQPCEPGCKKSHTLQFWSKFLNKHPETIKRWMREKRPGKPRLDFDRAGPRVVVISHDQMRAYTDLCKAAGSFTRTRVAGEATALDSARTSI